MRTGRSCLMAALWLASALGAAAGAANLTLNGVAKGKPTLLSPVNPRQIEVSLVPDLEEFQLGEPLHLTFLVKNNSDRDLQLSVGGDDRNDLGRPLTFTVVVKSDAGATLPPREVTRDWGGLGFAAKVPANGDYRFRLFLSHWAIIKKPGAYRITAKRILNFSTPEDGGFEDVAAQAEARFKVTPPTARRWAS